MNKLKYALLALFAILHNIQSQTVEPSAAINKNTLQIEIESIYSIQKVGSEKTISWSMPNTLFRYGLLNGFELQLNIPIIKEQLWKNDHLAQSLNKLVNLQVGFSVDLWKEKKLLPEASIMVRVILPTNKIFELDNIGKIISLNLSNKISKNLSLNYNIGHIQGADNTLSCFYIVNISYQTTAKLHFFIENFGDLHHQSLKSHNLNIGSGCNLSNNLILDLSAAKNLTNNTLYFGGILTWIINTKKN